ncbi:MAG: hypothetical protein MUO27_10575 [Sedimentisphaerales bacterium]|nr:hypothetical protein [Sedimentisphaerales bacterium]
MVADNKTGRYVAEKIALPAILVISLLAARLLVGLRSAVRMSAPLEPSHSGLSVSMPSGNGWRCEEKWMYEDAGFTVSSAFSVAQSSRGGIKQAYAHCHYLLAPQRDTLQERISQEATDLGGKVVETGQVAVGSLIVNWARIKTDAGERRTFEIIFGVCPLAAGRQLEIEVFQTEEEQGLAQQVFNKITKGIRFSDNGLLQAGAKVVSEVRGAGLSGILASDGRPVSLFILADAHGRAIGFTMDAMAAAQTDMNTAVKAASYLYMRGPIADEQVEFFRGDGAFEQFTWRVESNSRAGSKGIEMVGQPGMLVIRHLTSTRSVESRANREESKYVLGGAAVPDIVIDPVLTKLLDSDAQAIVVDVIRSDGTITPVYVEKMAPTGGRADSNAVRVEWLDGRGLWQQVYYDSSKKVVRTILGRESTYTLNRADANEIAETFPERAYLVRDRSQLLDREEP